MSLATSNDSTKNGKRSTEISKLLAKTFSPSEFCIKYNPDLQGSLMCVRSIAGLSLLEHCPKLTDVMFAYSEDCAKEWVKCQLLKVNDFIGVKQKLSDEQLSDLSMQIVCEFYYLNIAELCCFFGRLRSGKYEDFYGSIDPMRILKSLNTFCHDRRIDIERHEKEIAIARSESKNEERMKNSVSWDEFIKIRERAEHGDNEAKKLLFKT